MFIVLPILAFLLLFLALLGEQESRRIDPGGGMPAAFVKSAAVLGGYLVLSSEILSLFRGLTRAGVVVGWGMALAGIVWLGWRQGWILAGGRYLAKRIQRLRWDWFNVLAGMLLGLILALLFVVAVLSPPNNDDSLQYHMSRVVHWAQQGGLGHYAAAYLPVLMHPMGAELTILHVRLLWGNDRLANLVQWAAMCGSLIGIAGITALLKGKKAARWLAVAFAASVPIGVLEATSTQNDYVTAFWYVAFLFFVILSLRRALTFQEMLCMGLALGLGMLTKMTFYLYAFPVLVFFCVRSLMVAHQRGKAIVELILIGTMAALLNLGYWSRNFITFGSVFGSREYIAYHIISLGPGALLGGLARNLAQNLAMPNEQVTASMVNGLKRAFAPIDPTMKIFDLEFAWNHENLAGNPVHLMLAFSAFVIVFLRKQLRANRLLCTYLLLTIASYLTLGYGIYDFFGVRFQLPAFIAWAVPFGIVSESLVERSRVWPVAMTLLLFLMALPWLLFNRTRPVIAMRDSSDPLTIPCLAGCTAESVLIAPPTRVMFAGKLVLEEPYVQATNALKETGCRSVGLYLDSHDLEYLFWWLLEAPQSGIRLETLHAVPETERYLDPAYQPCAVLCTLCRQGNQIQDQFYGLDLVGDYSGRVQLYVDKRYWP